MKSKQVFFGLAFSIPILLFLLIFISIKNDIFIREDDTKKVINSSINKILPLGASRVEGASPDFESFRYELWLKLVVDGWKFEFIGTQTDKVSYPDFDGVDFDPDHEGRGGWTSGEILINLENWLKETGSPDIVLFSTPGGNDILNGEDYAETIQNINDIIDILQKNNPYVYILIEQPAPGKKNFMTGEISSKFEDLQKDVLIISQNQSTSISKVLPINMFTEFNDSFLADDVHYNKKGAKFIADRYYDVLKNILISE